MDQLGDGGHRHTDLVYLISVISDGLTIHKNRLLQYKSLSKTSFSLLNTWRVHIIPE